MTLSIHLLAAALAIAQVPSPSTPLTPADDPSIGSTTTSRADLPRPARPLAIAGASALIVSAGFWTFMIASLFGGARQASRHNAIVDHANLGPRPLDAHERLQLDGIVSTGRAENRNAIATGVTAGVLTVVGVALLGRARVLRLRSRGFSPMVVPRGLGLGWRVKF